MAWNDEAPKADDSKSSWTEEPPPKADEKKWYDVTPKGVWQAFKNELPSMPHGDPNRPWYDVSPSGTGQAVLNSIPMIGGIVGGSVAGPGGAGAGSVAGQSLKSSIETALGGGPQSRQEFYGDLAQAGKAGVEGQAMAESMPAMASKAADAAPAVASKLTGKNAQAFKTYQDVPQAVQDLSAASGNDVQLAADQLREKSSNIIESTKADLEQPALELMNNKGTALSDRQLGDAIKQDFNSEVSQKFGPFQKAYGTIASVNDAIPIADETRRDFTQSLKDWAVDSFPQSSDSYKTVKKFADSIDASNTGAQMKSVLGDISDEKNAAWKSQATNKYGLMKELHDRASQFFQDQVTDLAKRVSQGKATPDEMSGFEKMMNEQQNPTVPVAPENLNAYSKSVAKDYLNQIDTVNQQYKGAKEYLGSVNEQTGVKGNSTVRFIQELNATPSEKLVGNIDKLFDKNTAALEQMKEETPQVFDKIAKYRVKSLIQDSMEDGKLDVQDFHKNVQELEPEARNLLFSPQEQQLIAKTATNPKLVRLNELTDKMHDGLITPKTNPAALLAAGSGSATHYVRDLAELSQLTGTNLVRDAQVLNSMKELGRPEYMSRGGMGAGLGVGVGAAAGGALAGFHGAQVGGAVGGAIGGAVTSPAMLKHAIDLGRLVQPAVNAAPALQSVMRGAMGKSALRKIGP